jgi:hypothetical protein
MDEKTDVLVSLKELFWDRPPHITEEHMKFLQELFSEITGLRHDVKHLRAENADLRDQLNRWTISDPRLFGGF